MASIKTTSLVHPAPTIFSRPMPSVPTNSSSEARAFPTPNSRAILDCRVDRKTPGWPAVVCQPTRERRRSDSLVSSYLVRKFYHKDFDLLDDWRFREKLWSFRHSQES